MAGSTGRSSVFRVIVEHGASFSIGKPATLFGVVIMEGSHQDAVLAIIDACLDAPGGYGGYRQERTGIAWKTHLQGAGIFGDSQSAVVISDWSSRVFLSGTSEGMARIRDAVPRSCRAYNPTVTIQSRVISECVRYPPHKDQRTERCQVTITQPPLLSTLLPLLPVDPPSSPPTSPPSQWSFAADDDELHVGDSEEEEEPQAGGRQYSREDTPAPGYVPLPEMKGFKHVRLPDGRIAWLPPAPCDDPPPPAALDDVPPPPPGAPPAPPSPTTPKASVQPPGPRWRTARAAQDEEDESTVYSL